MPNKRNSGRRFPDKWHTRILFTIIGLWAGYMAAKQTTFNLVDYVGDAAEIVHEIIEGCGGLASAVFIFSIIRWIIDRRNNNNGK